jgi:hypothetical protein
VAYLREGIGVNIKPEFHANGIKLCEPTCMPPGLLLTSPTSESEPGLLSGNGPAPKNVVMFTGICLLDLEPHIRTSVMIAKCADRCRQPCRARRISTRPRLFLDSYSRCQGNLATFGDGIGVAARRDLEAMSNASGLILSPGPPRKR